MIKVGFIGAVSKEWMGGLNYFKNLLFALAQLDKDELDVIVFVGKQTDEQIKLMFSNYARVVEDSLFDRKSVKWFLMKLEQKLFKTNFLLSSFLKKYDIEVLSHASVTNLNKIKTINWIPDFQHLHLMHMFSKEDIKARDKQFLKLIKDSDLVVLSSYDALKDMNSFASGYGQKAKVLQFVSQPDQHYFLLDEQDRKRLLKKYDLPDEFYYLPNQFWKHKNHLVVFEAVKTLKDDGVGVTLVCSGLLDDYRNKSHIDVLKDFIKLNNLQDNIRLLGLVEYEDVFALIKFSKAVINPSLFEGWSSTVEECKSVGKNMILSNLDVHLEQYPSAIFFDRDSPENLAETLREYDFEESELNLESLEYRTNRFANNYLSILQGLVKD